jgi:hypothetical protein
MSENPAEPDVFEACARLRSNLATEPADQETVLVSRTDLTLILDVPLAHALTDDAVRRGVIAFRKTVLGTTSTYVSPIDMRHMRAAIVAALGGER